MNIGKEKYDAIPIPAELDAVITASMRRAERAGRLRSLRRFAASAAAVVCVLFACANIMPIYTYAAQIPILGGIVQVLQIGSGGELTDGAQGKVEDRGEGVLLSFEGASGELSAAPHYSVTRFSAPNRLELTLSGVRKIDFDALFKSLLGTEAVRDAYRMMVLDDSSYGIVIVLNEGWSCEITEYSDPGALMLNFIESAPSGEDEVYYLRSEAMTYTDELGLLCEEYHAEAATQLRTLSGEYIVTIGQYATRAEAEEALAALNEMHGESGFFVASGAPGDTPEN